MSKLHKKRYYIYIFIKHTTLSTYNYIKVMKNTTTI